MVARRSLEVQEAWDAENKAAAKAQALPRKKNAGNCLNMEKIKLESRLKTVRQKIASAKDNLEELYGKVIEQATETADCCLVLEQGPLDAIIKTCKDNKDGADSHMTLLSQQLETAWTTSSS